MPCSPEQLASNRRNAKLSTGPTSPEGRARVRSNAVKHGLSGAGLALPVEDAAEVERRFQALGDDLRPVGERERLLAHRAAFLSVRLDRCAAYETAALSEAIRTAEADHDRDIRKDIDDAVKRLPDDPISSVARLERTPEGVDWMLRSWGELLEDVTFGTYLLFNQVTRAENLLGRRSDEPCHSRINILASALGGNFLLLDPPGTPLVTDPARVQERKEAARGDLIAIIRAEIDRLQLLRAGLPFEDLARSRAEAPMRRLFDPSTSGVLFRRYETATARELHRVFAHFDTPRPEPEPRTGAEIAPEAGCGEANHECETACEELALSRNSDETDPPGPSSDPEGDGPSGSTALEGVDGGAAAALGMKEVAKPGRIRSGRGEDFELGPLVERHLGDLAIIAAEADGRLAAVQGLAAHLHAADGADPLALDDADDLGGPFAVPDPDALDGPDSGARLETGLGRRGDHRVCVPCSTRPRVEGVS